MISEIRVVQKHPPIGRTFGEVFGPPRPNGRAQRARQYTCAKFRLFKIGQTQACRYSTCRSQCPEHEYNFLFEIGLNLTKLRAITRCPYMDARANLGYYCAIKWPNFNIFQWDLFYMISTLELHYISKFQPSSC